MKILVIGDPHGVLPKKFPKNIDLTLITGDLGKADLDRKIYFENFERRRNGLPKRELTKTEAKKIHMEIHNSTLNVLKNYSKFAPVYTLQGNVGISNLELINLINSLFFQISWISYGMQFLRKKKKTLRKKQKE